MKTEFNREQLERIFHMYKPNAVYLARAEVEFPRLKAPLVFPENPVYLNEGMGITHINNTEVEMIINQGLFLFYRQVLLDGKEGFPQVPEQDLQRYYDDMFIKKEVDYYERFTPRTRKDLVLTLEHVNSRNIGSAQLVWCNLLIPEFMRAEVIGGIKLDK